jgi:hypothetical protein
MPADALADAMAWQLATLRELGDLCMGLARLGAAKAQAALTAPEDETPKAAPDPVRGFALLARAVRQTVGLHGRLLNGRQARQDRLDAEQAAKDAEAEAVLTERRMTGKLRRGMTGFIAQTAIEAEERDPDETERLLDALQAKIAEPGEDPLAYETIDVKQFAWALCQDLGVDPGPDWWMEGWGVEAPKRAKPPP